MKQKFSKILLITAVLLAISLCFTIDDTRTDHRPSKMKMNGRQQNKSVGFSLSDIFDFTAPNTDDGLNDRIRNRLTIEYTSCKDAWIDMFYWMALLYGDWYANHGGNTLMYFVYTWIWVKGPEWISLCFI